MDISADEQNRIRTQQLEQRAVIGEVINAFAHEVRNPINNISLGLTDLSSEFTEEDPKQEMINRIQGNCFATKPFNGIDPFFFTSHGAAFRKGRTSVPAA